MMNTGTSIVIDQPVYPKKLGILTSARSAMFFTMKFGTLPMYVMTPMNTAGTVKILAHFRTALQARLPVRIL